MMAGLMNQHRHLQQHMQQRSWASNCSFPRRKFWRPAAAQPSLDGPSTSPHCYPSTPSRTHVPSWRSAQQQHRPLSHSDRQVTATVTSSERGCTSTLIPASHPRLRIAVDVDEVLGRFVYTLNQFCKDHYNMHYDVADYTIYEFAKIWGCNQDRSNVIVHEFFKSQHFNDGIPVIPGALSTLERLSAHSDLVVVTSRQHVIQDITLEWIDRHFPGIFQEVYFGNHWSLEGVSRKKSDICKAIGATILIDDNPFYAIECANVGINVLLYDWELSYPWSKLPEGFSHPLIQVVRSWEEVEAALATLSPQLARDA